MSFQSLPTELYDAIFSHLTPPDLRGTVLAVTRAIPSSSVPLHHLFRNVRVSYPEQAIRLYRRLRQNSSYWTEAEGMRPASWVRSLSVESWSVDAEVVINVLRMLPHLQSLNIWVGPTNFTPERLEELFSKPLAVQYIAIRFRPYLQKANYYQFLRGSYFDASLLAMARWPSGALPVFSIVQDTCDPGIGQKQAFAQPIVFFRLDPCLSLLLHSPSMATLKWLRLRIPARAIARPLCGMTPSETCYASDLTPSPDLEFLDISTCNILDNELDMILMRFPSLKHLLLDGCPIFRGEGDWNDFGKRCALAGVRRAKQREKALKAWIEASQAKVNFDADEDLPNQERRARRGRKGLATATISLREPQPIAFWSSLRTPSQPLTTQNSLQRAARIRILPPPPTLETLSIMVTSWINPNRFSALRAEFEAGWAEGVALLAVTKARLRSSARNGCRVMRFSSTFTFEHSQDEWLEEGLEGLQNIDPADASTFGTSSQDNVQMLPPVLCFAGPGKGPNHEAHCGHSVGWEVMKDEF